MAKATVSSFRSPDALEDLAAHYADRAKACGIGEPDVVAAVAEALKAIAEKRRKQDTGRREPDLR